MTRNHLWRVCPKTGKRFFSPSGPWCLWLLPIIGLASLIWFIIRVTPKPSRMAYPCQRVAAPLATGFVLWLVGILTSALAFRKARVMLVRSRMVLTTVCLLVALVGAWVAVTNTQEELASAASAFVPSDAANTPMGTAKGINPGRVTWAHDTDSTSWGAGGKWWEDANTDQTVVNQMISDSLQLLTSESTDTAAWDALFRHLNITKDSEDVGYVSGDKIAIKINQVPPWSDYGWNGSYSIASPHVVYAVVKQLIDSGVPANDIVVYDASRNVVDMMYNKINPLGVRCGDRYGTSGRVLAVHDSSAPISFSNDPVTDPLYVDPLVTPYNGPYYPPTFVTEAKYFINLSDMKGHSLTGVTLCGKNLFGSIYNPQTIIAQSGTKGWSPGVPGLHKFIKTMSISTLGGGSIPIERVYGEYNAFVDLMGFEHFGGKTVLYISTALYVGKNFNETPNKWDTLGSDWPSSIFMSQDPVAIDSVGVDFLRNEPTLLLGGGLHVVRGDSDNYLHEAAQADAPPSGTFYNPNDDGVGLSSLGTHEHWNNATDRKYSRNLGTGLGIELLKVGATQIVDRHVFYNNSAWDGNDAGASAADDAARAENKFALLPGDGPADFTNYTSYSKGINGIMIDANSLSGTPAASDFSFRVGNDSNPGLWAPLAVTPSVSVRAGAGTSSSDRITLILPDGTAAGQWLEVTFIPAGDVFYFGNAIGETGDNDGVNAQVTPADEVEVRNNPATLAVGSASIVSPWDFNRDKKVGPTDMILCRNNGTNPSTALQLMTATINTGPTVNAGAGSSIDISESAVLSGSASDDGIPSPLTTTWTKLTGSGAVTFANASSASTTATFTAGGAYTLQLEASDGDKSAVDTVDITVAATISYFADDFDDDDLVGWTTTAGSFETFGFPGDSGYEVHATSLSSRMQAALTNTSLPGTVYMSFNIRHTGGAPDGFGSDTGSRSGSIWFVDGTGTGFGLDLSLSQDGTGAILLKSTTNYGATGTVVGSFATVPALAGYGLYSLELVYNRGTDQVECFFNGNSMGTVAVSSAYRDFTTVAVGLTENYFSFGPPLTHVWGQLNVDDIKISNAP